MPTPRVLRSGGRSRRGRLAALLVPLLLAAFVLAPAPGPRPAAASPATPAGAVTAPMSMPTDAEPVVVTLITGDTVLWSDPGEGNPRVEVEPAERGYPLQFDQSGTQEDFYVIPSDVAQHVGSGRLDRELFNIPGLIRQGLDDASTDGQLPVIVIFEQHRTGRSAATDTDAGTLADRANALPATAGPVGVQGINGAGITIDRNQAAEFRDAVLTTANSGGTRGRAAASHGMAADVEKVLLDRVLAVDLDESVPQIGAPQAWDAGYTGEGVTVAVLDTGVDSQHPDLAGQVVDQEVFVPPSTRPGLYVVEQLEDPVRYLGMVGALDVPKEGVADPLVNVGRACVDSEGDELLADPDGKTALIVRGVCDFSEKHDAAVEAGATAVVVYNNESGVFDGTIAGAEHADAAWAAAISDTDGAALLDLLDAGEEVVLGLSDAPWPGDDHGHGTHVAATIAGTGDASGGTRRGVAPGAKVLSGKVCDADGACPISAVMAGMEWAVVHGADIVNMSLGGDPTDGTDAQAQLLNDLSAETGTLFVTSAGNDGPRRLRVGSPATADAALAVGAVDKSDQLANFSSRGPRVGDHAVKPEITAPGVGIVAARADGTGIGTPVNGGYTSLNGTSMASPHVAGAAALLTQATGLTGQALKDALVSTAADGGYRWYEQGTGRVDVPSALGSSVYANATINFGTVDGQAEQELTYTNHSDSDQTLSLDVTAGDQTGRPFDGVALSADTITVPAGGQASVTVTVTIDPAEVSGQELFGGVVTATGDGVSLRTAIGFGPPLYEVTVEVLDSNGDRIGTDTAPDDHVRLIQDTFDQEVGGSRDHRFETSDGVAIGSVPAGVYTLIASPTEFDPETGGHVRQSLLVAVEIDIDRDLAITLDARDSVPIQVTVPRRVHKRAHEVALIHEYRDEPDGATFTLGTGSQHAQMYATPIPAGELSYTALFVRWYLAEPQPLLPSPTIANSQFFCERVPDPDARFCYSPTPAYIYNMAFLYENGIPDDLHERVTQRDLVEVPTRYHSDHPDALILRDFWALPPFFAVIGQMHVWIQPGQVTEYLLADDRMTWRRYASQRHVQDGAPPFFLFTQWSSDRFPAAEAGTRRGEERWFEGPVRIGIPDFREEFLNNDSMGSGIDRWAFASRGGPNNDEFVPGLAPMDNARGHFVDGFGQGVYGSWRMWNHDTGTELEPLTGSTWGMFPLVPEQASYRLEQTEEYRADEVGDLFRTGPATTTWTFTSKPSDAQVPDGYQCVSNPVEDWHVTCQVQPLIQLEYSLDLDIHNRAPAGRAHVFTVNAGHHSKAVDWAGVTALAVEASFDDGDTWSDARVLGKPKDISDTGGFLPSAQPYQQFRVVLKHPPLYRTNGYVTLRVQAHDANGGTVEQTIHRAYILE